MNVLNKSTGQPREGEDPSRRLGGGPATHHRKESQLVRVRTHQQSRVESNPVKSDCRVTGCSHRPSRVQSSPVRLQSHGVFTPTESSPIQSSQTLESRGIHANRVETNPVQSYPRVTGSSRRPNRVQSSPVRLQSHRVFTPTESSPIKFARVPVGFQYSLNSEQSKNSKTMEILTCLFCTRLCVEGGGVVRDGTCGRNQ